MKGGERQRILKMREWERRFRRTFPRVFNCRNCGAGVYITEPPDKRTCFCSAECCQKFWRHHYGDGTRRRK